MIVELAVTAGPDAGRWFRFTEYSTFIVGRSTQAHFSLPDKDPHVSRLHLLVEVNPPLCRLRNMSAVNGTVVNGTKVSAKRRDAHFGRVALRLMVDGARASTVARRSGPRPLLPVRIRPNTVSAVERITDPPPSIEPAYLILQYQYKRREQAGTCWVSRAYARNNDICFSDAGASLVECNVGANAVPSAALD